MADDGVKPDYKLSFYQGLPSSMDADYGHMNKGGYFSGQRVNSGQLAVTTDPRTANIIKEVNDKLNTGVKNVELTLIQTQLMQSVPKQYFEEARRVAKLGGAEVSVHGPLVEPSGIGQRGFSEEDRQAVERQIVDALTRVQPLNPDGNTLVTFHSALSIPPPTTMKEGGKEVIKQQVIVERETGRPVEMLKAEEKYYPGEGKKKIDIYEQINEYNQTMWNHKITESLYYKDHADRILEGSYDNIKTFYKRIETGEINRDKLTDDQKIVHNKAVEAQQYLERVDRDLKNLFNTAYKIGTEEEKIKLAKFSQQYKEDLGKADKYELEKKSAALQNLLTNLRVIQPKLFDTLDTFALEKTAKTFGDSAFEAYKKFGNKAPIIAIENPPADQSAFSRAEDLKKVIEKAREDFVEKAMKEKGMDRSSASKAAEKLIGATWDVGHINLIRKFGYDEADVVKETGIIAPFVKHVHLSDNFGIEHAELPMGMGNVPFEEMMKKLGKTGEKVTKVIEAGNWFSSQLGTQVPFRESLIGMGSPIYSMKAPYWNQTNGLYQEYYGGYGRFLPDINYETFGAGFTQLPMELGGNRQQGRGRMSGTPME